MPTLVDTENYIRLRKLEAQVKDWARQVENADGDSVLQDEIRLVAARDILTPYEDTESEF